MCEYCNRPYEDTTKNMHRICVEKDGVKRLFVACVHCIRKAKEDTSYDEYMINKTFKEKLGRVIKPQSTTKLAEAKEIIKFLLDHCEHNEDKCTFSEYSDVIGCAEEFINEE